MNIYYVYQYLRSKDSDIAESGTPYYIGKGKQKRAWVNHHNISIPSDKSLIEILITGLSEKAAHELEITLIKKYGRVDLGSGILRNLTDGGEGMSGSIRSAETRAKIAAARKGKTASDDARANMKAAQQNISAETRAKISAACKGRIVSKETCEKLSLNHKGGLGKGKMSSNSRAKISAVHKGKIVSEETRNKMSESKKGKSWSDAQRTSRRRASQLFS